MSKKNFLLGKGERLAEVIQGVKRPMEKISPYTFEEAKERLKTMVENVSNQIDSLPPDACPDEKAVAIITMNPEYIAKSYFPSELLRALRLETIGSRSRIIKPEKRSAGRDPNETITTELFVVGQRQSFKNWKNIFSEWQLSDPGASQLVYIEEVSFQMPQDKIKIDENNTTKNVYEVVLHLNEDRSESRYLSFYIEYLKKQRIKVNLSKRFYAGGLCFLELTAPENLREYIAQFSLVRVVRTMPTLRLLNPAIRTGGVENNIKVELPSLKPMDSNIKVAIFDGGIPTGHPITKWVKIHEVSGIGPADISLQKHGVGVTSAFLFGHIEPKFELPQPYSYVDHFRVLDTIPGENPYELFEILDRINDVLQTSKYDFVNLSLGPRLPIEDDEVHAWTAVLDDYLSKNPTLTTIAVGNDGHLDASINANRIQVPSDCVNALGIGACDVPDDNWQRAEYSSIGPGRSPGIVKPDLVEFGGSISRPFLTIDAITGTEIIPTGGTSFASPSVLRLATGVKAHFGNGLGVLAIRTLLVHCAEKTTILKKEVGFGRVARTLEDIVVCPDGVVRVVFQGKISASKYIRVPIPIPIGNLPGNLKIKATLCYATAVDPHHPENYTRSGLEISFRPNKNIRHIDKKTGRESVNAVTKPFFGNSNKEFQTEVELRRDAMKWENCMHAERNFRGKTLMDPVFDIHYNARQEGHNDTHSQEIEYALVISVKSNKITDIYDSVVRRYNTILEQLAPLIEIPVRV
jgi:hypothetical protein